MQPWHLGTSPLLEGEGPAEDRLLAVAAAVAAAAAAAATAAVVLTRLREGADDDDEEPLEPPCAVTNSQVIMELLGFNVNYLSNTLAVASRFDKVTMSDGRAFVLLVNNCCC